MGNKSVEEIRGEQSKHAAKAADIESRCRANAMRAEERLAESQTRLDEYDKRTESLDSRIRSLSQALAVDRYMRDDAVASVEGQVKEVRNDRIRSPRIRGKSSPRAHRVLEEDRTIGVSVGVADADRTATQILTSESLQRLETLEARLELGMSSS